MGKSVSDRLNESVINWASRLLAEWLNMLVSRLVSEWLDEWTTELVNGWLGERVIGLVSDPDSGEFYLSMYSFNVVLLPLSNAVPLSIQVVREADLPIPSYTQHNFT
jgi:hypothetical protein